MNGKKCRKFAFFLVLAMLATLAAGCNNTKPPDSTTPKAQTSGATTPASAGTTAAPGPEFRTFNGRTITISSAWIDGMWKAFPDESELGAEKQAIYDKLESDLDIKIELLQGESKVDNVIPILIAGDLPTDL